MVSKKDESEMCLSLQGYDLIGISGMWWDGSQDCSVVMEGWVDEEGVLPSKSVTSNSALNLFWGMNEELTDSRWVRIKERARQVTL